MFLRYQAEGSCIGFETTRFEALYVLLILYLCCLAHLYCIIVVLLYQNMFNFLWFPIDLPGYETFLTV